jgi:pimeloyl-ACP methyl ester carboxylesterase
MPDAYYAPVASEVPTLILSGELDPVTPAVWGAQVARHLTRSRHVTMRGTGHGVVTTACGNRLITRFLEIGRAETLDTGCAARSDRPPFVLTASGPDSAEAWRTVR